MPGGVLASDVGAGKTITVIGLLSVGLNWKSLEKEALSKEEGNPEKSQIEEEEYKSGEKERESSSIWKDYSRNRKEVFAKLVKSFPKGYLPSLVIVTKNILYQWVEEIKNFCPELRVLFIENLEDFDKISLDKDSIEEERGWHVILTHRDIFDKELPSNHNIFKIQFQRIIIDEIHEITNIIAKNNKIKAYKKI